MKLVACIVLIFSTCVAWAQDEASDNTPPVADATATADSAPAESPPSPHQTAWRPSLDIAVRSTILVPAFDSSEKFTIGGGLGAELSVPLPINVWHARGGLDVGSLTSGGKTYYLTTLRPGISYDAFTGPTAFMSFEVEAGWLLATGTDLSVVDNKLCAGAGTSISFYLGDHVNFRTDLRYLEVFGTIHLFTFSLGFDVIGD